jgi:transposase
MHRVWSFTDTWADAKAQFTALFERLAIVVLRESDVLGATHILRISWDEAWHILERAVARGLVAKGKRGCTQIGVDEKSVGRGHCSVTLVCDLGGSTVEYIGDDRKKESLDRYFLGLLPEQRERIAVDSKHLPLLHRFIPQQLYPVGFYLR